MHRFRLLYLSAIQVICHTTWTHLLTTYNMSPQDRNVYYGNGQYEPGNSRNQTYPRQQVYSESTQQWHDSYNVNYSSPYNVYPGATVTPSNYHPYMENTMSEAGNEILTPNPPEHHYRALPITTDEQLDNWISETVDTLGRRSFVCRQPGCGISHPRRNAAYSHIRRDHLGEEKTFECVVCGQLFATENTARRHRDNQERRFTCSYCHRSFARQDYYRTHERRCQEHFI